MIKSSSNSGFHNMKVDTSRNLFAQVSERLGVFKPGQGLNDIAQVTDESTQTFSNSPLDQVRREAEFMAKDVVVNFNVASPSRAPNRYCKTLRRTVKELSDRHNLVFKGMVNRLKPEDESSLFSTFVIVADEIFDDGQVNWGRIVAVYAFAARLALYYIDNNSSSSDSVNDKRLVSYQEKIALFVGKYVASKLGKWILDHGGWDAFVEYFPDQGEFEEKIWKGVLFTAIGLGALATVVASR
ncbi:apoptosis regulator Bcl-2 [Aplysia californica]|uniref:Apoptosis regulator Bcl-2 n=1 Tax=Aplysia californica TaxID=6500 RepID=A0ABM0JAD5_APLCA|nr:apoptosis regulator Bcl-2 [Aplysia californica]